MGNTMASQREKEIDVNSAQLENSQRLQRTIAVLEDGREHTTLNIIANAKICAVNSAVAELRDNGFDIKCQRRGDLWFYKMEMAK